MQDFLDNWVYGSLRGLGRIALLAFECCRALVKQRPNRRDVTYHMYHIGVKSLSVVLITGAFTGMVLCAQTFFQFHRVKIDTATLAVVSVSMCTELGPVLAGLMLAGRVGASMAAELGTMKVTEQIDALRSMATHPVDYLVVPRVLASVVTMPLLTIGSITLGIVAAYLLGVCLLGIDPAYGWYNMVRYTTPQDVLMGLCKSFCFGIMVSLIGCYKGMYCREGAEGVGRATTEAVVYASISILISNFFLTLLLQKVLK
ncbi:MAG: ABC transporter permease [Verrucomicrobiota bacterium]